MTRRKGTSRVTRRAGSGSEPGYEPVDVRLPSLRQRRPVMYWTVVIAVLAMVLSTIASFVSAFA